MRRAHPTVANVLIRVPPVFHMGSVMDRITPGEETMIGALARQVKDGDWAACGTLSPLPAAALWLA